ncbi:unnamed protein product [Eruca vesicaria subsp. sativa]|uniref:Replication factor A C-terminal domain-containing protein n=1 Tax=Eruca vesicaria subsp. sativa TaxID=29727 RepID=A0ABC8JP85_ERUVS|nr:unnamed protein product [Eruca vesicaria subsp. sativa]
MYQMIPLMMEKMKDELGFHYYCVKCKVKNPKLMPRYKFHLAVLDNTGNAKFLLFDNLDSSYFIALAMS